MKLLTGGIALTQEAELAERLANDLDRHFEQLVLAYQDRIYAFALRLTNNPQDAEEVAQDTFVRAYRALLTCTREQIRTLALRPWLYQIALNNFKNRVRRKRHPSISFDQAGPTNALEPLEDEQQSPEMLVEARETGEMLGQLVAALPQRYRAAVILRHIEGLGYAELAAILHQPVGTIKANVHRGTALLRKAISQQIYEKEVV